MKELIITSIIFFTSSVSFCQIDSSKVEQYCEVIATPRLLSNIVTIDINYGEQKSIWKDTRLKDDEGKLKKFNTVIDALNYMGKDGWIFVNAFPILNGTTQIYHYVFKKWFAKNEAGE